MLYHGSSVDKLNNILLNGLLSRSKTNNSNFKGDLVSNENLVYMTNKWHYFYAYNAISEDLDEPTTGHLPKIPCYIEAKVPKKFLVHDEDFFHSKYMLNKIKNCIKKNQRYLEVTWEESLAQYATVAVLEEVKREWFFSFTILLDMEKFFNNFISPNSQYAKDLRKWGEGKSKGKLKFMDLVELEDSEKNTTYFLKDIPKNYIITDAFINEITGMLSLKLGKIKNN